MELRDVVGSRSRIRLLIVVAALAMAAATVLTLAGDREYRARAVFVAPSANRGSPSAIEQSVANLRANLTADPVVNGAAEAGGLGADEVRDGLTLDQRGSSDTVELTFTTKRDDAAQEVVRAAAVALMGEVTSADVDRATDQVRVLEEDVDALQQELDNFLAQNGLTLPDEEYRQVASELTALKVALANALIDGSLRSQPLQDAVNAREASLIDLAPKVRVYLDIVAAVDRASRRLDLALDAEAQAESFRAAVAPTNLEVTDVRSVPRTDAVLRAAASSGAIAVFICVLIFVLLELRRPPRPARELRVPRRGRVDVADRISAFEGRE